MAESFKTSMFFGALMCVRLLVKKEVNIRVLNLMGGGSHEFFEKSMEFFPIEKERKFEHESYTGIISRFIFISISQGNYATYEAISLNSL
jgi:hypothetical protein